MPIRARLAALAALVALGLPAPAGAADTRLDRLTLRQETLGWEGVGRLDLGGEGFCTGVLVAPDRVLTAAHCLVDPRTGARRDPAAMRFRAALSDGVSIAERAGRQAVIHPDYAHDDADGLRQLRSDVGLVVLDAPIPAAEAAPFAVGAPVESGDQVSVVSYARGRAEAMGWQRACGVRGRGRGVLLMTCDTDFGSSGAPVFELSAGRPRLVSLISRGSREGGHVQVWGMEIAEPLAETKVALASGRGVWPTGEVRAKRVQVGGGSGSTGARFLRP